MVKRWHAATNAADQTLRRSRPGGKSPPIRRPRLSGPVETGSGRRLSARFLHGQAMQNQDCRD